MPYSTHNAVRIYKEVVGERPLKGAGQEDGEPFIWDIQPREPAPPH